MKKIIKIVGAGLAGCETALALSKYISDDVQIYLIEMRPKKSTQVHKTDKPAELVCSNSLKSTKPTSAAGMLKFELETLNSPLYNCALSCKVEAGGALAVDRVKFSETVLNEINKSDNIIFERREVINIKDELDGCDYLVLATGPLTSDKLADCIVNLTGSDHLAFYDAAAPIIDANSIDRDIVFEFDRYKENALSGDYLNCPLNNEQYDSFISELLSAEPVIKKDFETKDLFSACQPIEEVARSGHDAPRFGAMKPVGIIDPNTGQRPYAVVQLRSENKERTSYNLVGFQTNLTFSEQARVFSMIPGLQNADFCRYGVMHRNTFINSPQLLNEDLILKSNNKIYVAGQLSGTEGYLEAVRSGHHCAISIASKIRGNKPIHLSSETAFGSLVSYSTNPNTKNYQPMHVNFGIIKPLENNVRNKSQRYERYAKRGSEAIKKYKNKLNKQGIICE